MSTEKPRPLTGYRENQETKKDTPIDPKKFQEAMSKVSESDASQQGKKRHLKKTEEEGEEEVEAGDELPSPGAEFSDIMSGKSSSDGLLAPQTPQNTRAATTESSSDQFTLESDDHSEAPSSSESASAPSKAPVESQPASSEPPSYVESPLVSETEEETQVNELEQEPGMAPPEPVETEPYFNLEEETPKLHENESPSNVHETQKPKETEHTDSPKRVKKKQTKDTSLLADKHPSTAQIAKKKQIKNPDIHVEKGKKEAIDPAADTSAKPVDEKKEAPKVDKPPQQTQKAAEPTQPSPLDSSQNKVQHPIEKTPLSETPHETKKLHAPKEHEKTSASDAAAEKASMGGKSLDLESGFSHDHQGKEDDSDDKIIDPSGAITPEPSQFQPDISKMPETPAYTHLNPNVFELFERMVGTMMIQIHDKGHTQTTVTINMKGSIFDGSKIILDHYSSAPNSFNVEIATTAKGRELLMDNLNLLTKSFEQSDANFNVNRLRPVLLESHKEDFTRKEATSGDKDDSEGQRGGQGQSQ